MKYEDQLFYCIEKKLEKKNAKEWKKGLDLVTMKIDSDFIAKDGVNFIKISPMEKDITIELTRTYEQDLVKNDMGNKLKERFEKVCSVVELSSQPDWWDLEIQCKKKSVIDKQKYPFMSCEVIMEQLQDMIEDLDYGYDEMFF